jgi:two-component system, LytTR family, response regulator
MEIYRTVIIEDNPNNAAVLRKIIAENHLDLKIVAEANTVALAKDILLTHKPDIALMDIELTPGTSFDVLAELNEMDAICFEIIFITAHQRYDYATKAIDFSSLAFLNKPIDPEILRGAIEKAKEKQTRKIQIDQLLAKLQTENERPTHLIIPTLKNNKTAISIADIAYFEADGQITKIHLQDKTIVPAYRILGHFKKMLMDEYPFFLIHNSLLLNVEQVQSFKNKELEVVLKNGETLTTSRRFGKDFKQYWETFESNKSSFWKNLKRIF